MNGKVVKIKDSISNLLVIINTESSQSKAIKLLRYHKDHNIKVHELLADNLIKMLTSYGNLYQQTLMA